MSQCVPSWDVDDNPPLPRVSLCSNSNSNATDVPMLDYEVAELTWENGQISMHGLGLPRVPVKPATTTVRSKCTWEKPQANGTLESIVNQATSLPHPGGVISCGGNGGVCGNVLVPWIDPHHVATIAAAAAASNTMGLDALVPCSNRTEEQSTHVTDSIPGELGLSMMGCSARMGSCNGASTGIQEEGAVLSAAGKRTRVARVPVVAHERSQSISGSATFGRDSQHVTLDTCDKELGLGFTSTSLGSPENTTSATPCTKATTVDDYDSVCHSRPMKEDGDKEEKKRGIRKSSVLSTKRSRAAAIHNQSERKRRDKINQKMKTLQKLVPNSSKTDKASMLDEVIEYLKQLQAQVQMMNRINMSSMMLPMTLQHQLQMSMMAPMGMGMGMGMGVGMGMDLTTMNRANIPGIPPVLHPSAFMPMASWDATTSDRLQGPPATMMPDPLPTFFGCQSLPVNMDAYSRIAAMYQQLHQPPASSSKS